MLLSSRFESALQYAAIMHAGQMRKGGPVPYLAHILGVTSIALEYGADEDEAIAALLHDGPEDCGGRERLDDIRARFGDKVAEIVEACTDTFESPKPPWSERKQKYVSHVSHATASERLVSAADKLHNSRAILRDLREVDDAAFAKFSAPKKDVLWYYRALVEAFRKAEANALVEELDRVVTEMERLAGA